MTKKDLPIPPLSPWKEVKLNATAGGSLSFYYSDNLSSIPVRFVTKVGDNKADPNLETLTYGMFSTCQKGLRSAFVREGRRYLFFFTKWKDSRVLVGYYAIKWYTPVVNSDPRDFALAADKAHFMAKPLSFVEIDKHCQTNLNKKFRMMLNVSNDECSRLVKFIDSQPNALDTYISEIHRLEHFNKSQSGYKYVGRKLEESFSWDVAAPYIVPKPGDTPSSSKAAKNSSPSGWWTCTNCGGNSKNQALLRICPNCGGINTLVSLALPPTPAE